MSVSVLAPTGWKSLGGGDVPWSRPADWLPSTVVAGQQKVQCLLALGADPTVESNRVMALTVTGSNYTVDWGDGTAPQNVANGLAATHLYDPATLTATSEGWEQALVTITPQSGNLTSLNLATGYYAGKTWRSPVVEVVCGSSSLTTLSLGQACPLLRRVEFKQPFTPATPANLFLNCYSLHEVVGEMVLNGISTSSVFSGCSSLTKFPKLTFTAVATINVSSFFSGCAAMVEPPLFNAPAGSILTWASCYTGCISMRRLPAGFSVQGANTLASTFLNCYALEEVPLLDTAAVTVLTSTFQNCFVLRRISLTSTAAVTTAANAFNTCTALESLTNQDWSAMTSAASLTTILAGSFRLAKLGFLPGKGPKFTWALLGQVDAAGLNDIYTQLPVTSGQTITVTQVAGTLADDPTIATAKGWTVTGS